jgi:hypothetical protein
MAVKMSSGYKPAKGSKRVKGSPETFPKTKTSADSSLPFQGVADSRPGPSDQKQSAD